MGAQRSGCFSVGRLGWVVSLIYGPCIRANRSVSAVDRASFCIGALKFDVSDETDTPGKPYMPGRSAQYWLEIPVISGDSVALGFERYPIGVGVYYGVSVSPDTLNYRAPEEKRDRPRTETGTVLAEISVISGDSAPLGFGRYPIGVGIC